MITAAPSAPVPPPPSGAAGQHDRRGEGQPGRHPPAGGRSPSDLPRRSSRSSPGSINGMTETFVFHGGSFKLKVLSATSSRRVNPRSCLATITRHAQYKLAGGTGKYAGSVGTAPRWRRSWRSRRDRPGSARWTRRRSPSSRPSRQPGRSGSERSQVLHRRPGSHRDPGRRRAADGRATRSGTRASATGCGGCLRRRRR
jgi:hypothetical protein